MKVDFKKIILKDIEGKEIPNQIFYKTIANVLYLHASNLDLVDIAMSINRGEEVEINKDQLKEIRDTLNDPKVGIFSYAKKEMNDFINEMLLRKEVVK